LEKEWNFPTSATAPRVHYNTTCINKETKLIIHQWTGRKLNTHPNKPTNWNTQHHCNPQVLPFCHPTEGNCTPFELTVILKLYHGNCQHTQVNYALFGKIIPM